MRSSVVALTVLNLWPHRTIRAITVLWFPPALPGSIPDMSPTHRTRFFQQEGQHVSQISERRYYTAMPPLLVNDALSALTFRDFLSTRTKLMDAEKIPGSVHVEPKVSIHRPESQQCYTESRSLLGGLYRRSIRRRGTRRPGSWKWIFLYFPCSVDVMEPPRFPVYSTWGIQVSNRRVRFHLIACT